MKKITLALALAGVLALSCAAVAQTPNITGNTFQTGQPGKTVQGSVGMCVNASNVAVPCAPAGSGTPVSPTGATTTKSVAAPTALTFGSLLAANSARKACTIQNVGTTLAYIYPGASGGTTANSYQVSAGGTFSCVNGVTTLTDGVTGTCASGTCAFVISEQ